MPSPFPLPVALVAALPAGLPGAPRSVEALAWLPFLLVAGLLWRQGRRLRGAARRLLTLLAVLALSGVAVRVIGGLAGAAWGWAAVAAVAVAWWAAARLVRAVPRAFGRWEWAARGGDIDQLQLLEAAVAASGDGVMIAEACAGPESGLRVTYANPAFEGLTGYTASEAIGLSPSVFAADGDDEDETARLEEESGREAVRAALRATRPTRLEVPSRRKDGSRVWAEWHVVPVADASGRFTHCVAVLRDTTARRRAEETVRRTAELLKAVADGTTDAVFVKDRQGRYLLFNPAAARFVGKPAEEVIGKDDTAVFDPDSARQLMERDRRIMETGRAEAGELTLTAAGPTRTYHATKAPYRDGQGNVIGLVGISRDVTDRKRLDEQLRQAAKLEAVGRLAGGIAHDFNNLLTVISGNADLLREVPPDDPAWAERVEDIRGATDRAAALVRQLLTFGRRQPAAAEVIDLGEAVAATAAMLGRLLGERITVTTEPASVPVPVRIDRGRLEQVVMNLALNAKDAMPAGGVLTLRTEVAETAASHPEVPPARSARLVVSDTGVGMTDDVKAKIFEPFFTTKGPDRGTGLGLATAYAIVEQAGGRIEVESAPGCGATFRIDFPWCESPPDVGTVSEPCGAARPPAVGGLSVLLVEDEDGVRGFTRLALEAHGYAVTDAPDGETAVVLLDPARPFDLLVTDVVMPGMDGRELAGRVRAAWPESGVVFMSGYVPDPARLAEVPDAVFLPKPFTPADLVGAAGRALARAPQPVTDPPAIG
jgi:two-component system cell cycle sensor histidine kinase/response regulator CckA